MTKTLPVLMHTNFISNAAILTNNYISMLSDLQGFVHMCTSEENGVSQMKPYSSSVTSLKHFKGAKK